MPQVHCVDLARTKRGKGRQICGGGGSWHGGALAIRHSKQVHKEKLVLSSMILYNLTLLVVPDFDMLTVRANIWVKKNCWGAWCAWQDLCWLIPVTQHWTWLKFIHPETQWMILCAAKSRTPPPDFEQQPFGNSLLQATNKSYSNVYPPWN